MNPVQSITDESRTSRYREEAAEASYFPMKNAGHDSTLVSRDDEVPVGMIFDAICLPCGAFQCDQAP